jgi:hypothetical protein
LHRLIFEPPLRYPIKSLDLPAGGSVSAATALRMTYDFISMTVGVADRNDDPNGERTVSYLVRAKRAMRLLLSNDPSSLGLHPAVYFYSWTGKQIPIMFLSIADLILDIQKRDRLPEFTNARRAFEDFLIVNRALTNQVIRKFGATPSGRKHLLGYYQDVLRSVAVNGQPHSVLGTLQSSGRYSYLQPDESPYDGVTPTKFSTQVKSGIVIQELSTTAPRCPICGGLLPAQAISVDHLVRLADGGASTDDNAQLTHPYCNTGFKEASVARSKRVEAGTRI